MDLDWDFTSIFITKENIILFKNKLKNKNIKK